MKKIFLALLLCCVQSVFAQSDTKTTSSEPSKLSKFESFIGGDYSIKNRGTNFRSANLSFTYSPFKVIGAQVETRGDLMLHHRDGRHWDDATVVGGGLRLRLTKEVFSVLNDAEIPRIDVIATMGSTIDGDFNHTYYDGRISCYPLESCKNFAFTIGYRHYNMHNDVFGKYNFFYMGIAYKMNLF